MYEDEIFRLRVDNPEYDDEDDDALFTHIFGGDTSDAKPSEGGGAE